MKNRVSVYLGVGGLLVGLLGGALGLTKPAVVAVPYAVMVPHPADTKAEGALTGADLNRSFAGALGRHGAKPTLDDVRRAWGIRGHLDCKAEGRVGDAARWER